MKRKILYISFTCILLILTRCITEYTPNIDNVGNMLVVEGVITSGTTIIRLTESIGLNEDIDSLTVVEDATVMIESDDKQTYLAKYMEDGEYHIPLGELNNQIKYRVNILFDGKEYQSDFSNPIDTPEMDELGWNKGEKDGETFASFYVSTEGSEDQPLYYKWSYDEIWEIRSPVYKNYIEVDKDDARARMVKDPYFKDTLYLVLCDEINGPFSERYHCWVYNSSNQFLLASAKDIHENKIIRHELFQKKPSDRRFQELYYIKVTQNMISKEAFDYFSNLQKNINNTGNIFPPIPSEMKGNIRCITNPEIPVIGYVEASNTKTKELFIRNEDGLAEGSYIAPRCVLYETPLLKDEDGNDVITSLPVFDSGLERAFFIEASLTDPRIKPFNYTYAPCFDCVIDGGTKNKPDFWPNDHQ